MDALVGYSGFVGQNLNAHGRFSAVYNSKNIEDAFGTSPDCLYFCGIGAQKFLANTNPAADLAVIEQAMENIQRINPKRIVLISTIDVYKNPVGVDEDSEMHTDGLHPYGLHRLRLEQWVEDAFSERLIVRLPGLYGAGLKKNFIFDMMTIVPAMLTEQKFASLDTAFLSRYYTADGNGFYKLRDDVGREARAVLRGYFESCGFTALSFTDSRSVFQFYNLAYLYGHIQSALAMGIRRLNIAAEPVQAGELFAYIYGKPFVNEIAQTPTCYDYRSKHARRLGGADGYLFSKAFVLEDVKKFVQARSVF